MRIWGITDDRLGLDRVVGRWWRKDLRLPPSQFNVLKNQPNLYSPANDSAALAAKPFDLLGIDSITFISCQSYGNSFPQPRHATYVPVSWAAGESRWPGRFVIGKLKFLWLQPNRTSSRLAIISPPPTTGLPGRFNLPTQTIVYYRTCPNVHISSCPPYCYIRFRVPEKGSSTKEHNFCLCGIM